MDSRNELRLRPRGKERGANAYRVISKLSDLAQSSADVVA